MKIVFIILFFVTHSQSAQTDPMESVSWLVGTWERHSKKGPRYETWRRDAAGNLRGMGFAVSNGDTTKMEGLRLLAEDGFLVYVADVAENAGEVFFPIIAQSDSMLVFENLDHDYPKRIVYMRIGTDSLDVYTEDANIGEKRIWFRFRRIQF